ncbi:MAG: zinc ribbon domain-containing protein [Planctomycetaceae bacterium]
MSQGADNPLAELHRLHLQLREVQEQIDRGPRQVKARQQALQQKQAELEACRQKQKSLKVAADQKSLQLKSNEAKIDDLRVKLNQASSNREFDIIRAQIDADKMANSVLEDEILDALEKVDAAQIAVKQLEAGLITATAEEVRLGSEIEAALPALAGRQAELQQALAAVETRLPGDIVPQYRRLVQAHGAAALAELDGNTCSSCYVSLPPQVAMQVRAGQIIFCKTCGRLLYRAGAAP